MSLPSLRSGFAERIERLVTELAPELVERKAFETLSKWLGLVVDWNQRVDLTAARSHDELVDLCLADGVVIARQSRELGAQSVVDVGTGLGAPGIALSVLAPELELTLVEPKAKRVAFLRTVCGSLGLSNVRVHRARSDELTAKSFDVAVSRATLPPPEWLAEGARLATERVWVLLAKGETPELQGWYAETSVPYRWPLSGVTRRAVAFRAEGKSSKQ